ncbi:serine/threonine protein kinase, partial [Pseudoloma neurophilia]
KSTFSISKNKPPPNNKMEIQYDIGHYKTIRVLGEGRYATVYEGISKNGEIIAMKVLNKNLINTTNPDFIKNELAVFKKINEQKLKCKNILSFINFYDEIDNVFIILEYINGYTLQRVIFESFNTNKKIKAIDKKNYLIQIGNGLIYLHNLNIYHCDLKPENILIYDDNGTECVKILDFGCSHIALEGIASAKQLKFSGTAGFFTPEVYNDTSKNIKLKDLDTWAFTCLIYYCFVGKQPFVSKTFYLTVKNTQDINISYENTCKNIQKICKKVFIHENRAHLNELL